MNRAAHNNTTATQDSSTTSNGSAIQISLEDSDYSDINIYQSNQATTDNSSTYDGENTVNIDFDSSLSTGRNLDNDVTINQKGDRNEIYVLVDNEAPAYRSTGNRFNIDQDGKFHDTTISVLDGADYNTFNVDLEDTNNNVDITVDGRSAYGNSVEVTSLNNSDGNEVSIDINDGHMNVVDVDHRGSSDDNQTKVEVGGDHNDVYVDFDYNSDDNQVLVEVAGNYNDTDIDILGGSDYNHVQVTQLGDSSVADVRLVNGSDYNDMIMVTQTTNDYANVYGSNADYNSVTVTQN